MLWRNDQELFDLARAELFSALIGDVLDANGYYHQFLPQEIKPLSPEMKIVGRAMTVLECDVFGDRVEGSANKLMEKPFGLMFHALDDLKENEIYVCSGTSSAYAMWGGLMSTRAKILKCGGVLLNGYSRDTPEVLASGFPCFSRGTYAQDQGVRGKVVDYRVPIEIGGVRIQPGDIIYGDLDGVVAVPRAMEETIFTQALEKGRAEKKVREAILQGMSTVDAFAKFGIM